MYNKYSKFDRELIKLQHGSVANYHKKLKEESEQAQKLLKIDENIKSNIIMKPFMDNIRKQDKRDKQTVIKKELLKKYNSNDYNYNIFLLVWDLCYNSIYQIESSIKKGKVTINDYYNIANEFLSAGAIDYIIPITI